MASTIFHLTDYWSINLFPPPFGLLVVAGSKISVATAKFPFTLAFPEAWESHLHWRTGVSRVKAELGLDASQNRGHWRFPLTSPFPALFPNLNTRQLSIEHPPTRPLTFAEVEAAAFQWWQMSAADLGPSTPPAEFPAQTFSASDTLWISDRWSLTAFDPFPDFDSRWEPMSQSDAVDFINAATLIEWRLSHQETVDWFIDDLGLTDAVLDDTPISLPTGEPAGSQYALVPVIDNEFPWDRTWTQADFAVLTIRWLLARFFVFV
jgi:hypothetical protein